LAEPDAAGMSAEGLLDADRTILEAIEDSVFTAAALAVGRHGRLVRLAGYGETVSGAAVDAERTLFDIASLTKVVATTTAAAILVDEGELEFDDPVREHLREFRGEHKGEVTIRHLLSHTSGL